jgi:RNA-directed DNA polymerase
MSVFIKHFLSINDFRILLTQACTQSPMRLLGFIPEYVGEKTTQGNVKKYIRDNVCDIANKTAIFQTLWSWATRRHPKKSGRWIAQKYFQTRHGRQWTFVGTRVGHHGQPQELTLCRAGDVPIQRHVKIKGAANPYDPQWEVYFEERVGVQMTHNLQGRRQLLYLWKHQEGLCPVCHQKITRLTGWHNHHVVWRTHGGRDTADNRVLLHPTCHRQVHSQTLDGAQPRSTPSVQKA